MGRLSQTEPERAARRHEWLTQASAALALSLEPDEAIARIGAFAVDGLADWCVVYVVGEDGAPAQRRVTTARTDAGELVAQFQGLPLDPARAPLRHALLEGRSFLTDLDAETLATATPDEARVLRAMGAVSAMLVPLQARSRISGAMLFLSCAPGRGYDDEDLAVAEELAQLAALGLDNARLYQEARSAARARDEVLNVVAHDLRSPLNGILLTLDLVAEKLVERGAADLVDPWLRGIEASARDMNRIIGELLEITRLERGRVALTMQPLAVAGLLERAAAEARAADAGLRLRVAAAPDLPAVMGDEEALGRVLDKLIGNTARFRADERAEIVIAAACDGPCVRISVTDPSAEPSGEELEHVFDRFWKPGHVDRRGAALGLSIARALVVLHGGRIWAAAEQGGGITLAFTIAAA